MAEIADFRPKLGFVQSILEGQMSAGNPIEGSKHPRPRKVVVVGGTHGNEKGGIWVVREMLRSPDSWRYANLDVSAVLANPDAAERNLRYLDRDLNRCFGPELRFASATHEQRERRRALEIRDEICPGGLRPDLVVDLHNTTAAMGITWILPSLAPWPLYLASQARKADDRVKILHAPESPESNIFLPSLGAHEVTLEIGAVPHGTHSHWAWLAARQQVRGILERLASCPDGFDPAAALREERFEYFQTISVERYPADATGTPRAMVHMDAIGRDYQPFEDGAPLFVDPIDGSTIPHKGATMHPVFLGEAAYVESGIAYHATRRLRWTGSRGEPC